jgi:hypothetical protein
MTGMFTAILGMLLIVALPLDNNKGRLAGYYLTQASPTAFVALLSLIASNVAGYTKKTTVAAMYLIGYCVGNIIGTLFHPLSPPPITLPVPVRPVPDTSDHRSPNFPSQRRPPLRPRRNHNHRMLGRLHRDINIHSFLLRVAEQEEGGDQGGAGVCADGKSGVVGPDG